MPDLRPWCLSSSSPPPHTSLDHPLVPATPQASNVLTSPNRERTVEDAMLGRASTWTPVEKEAQATDAINHHLAGEIVQIQNRLRQQEYSIQSIQGEVANLSNKVTQIGISLGVHIQDGTSHYQATGFGIHQDVQFSEVSQCYGLHNLNRHSLFRADGTEHSYFALPADYPLERVVPEPVLAVYNDDSDGCSTEFVHVFNGTPNQLTYEEEKRESRQAPKCFSKSSENSLPPVVSEFTLQDIPDVYVPRFTKFRHEQWIQETSGDVQHLKLYKWNISLIEEGREDWDPGILKTIMKIAPVVNWSSLEGLPPAVIFSPKILLFMIVYAATYIPSIMVSLPLRMLWDPGASIHFTSILTREISNHLIECNSLTYLLHSAEIRYPRILSYFFILRYNNAKCNSRLITVLLSMGDQVEYLNLVSLTTPWDPGTIRDATWLKNSSSTSGELSQSWSVKCSSSYMMSFTTYTGDPGVKMCLHSWLDMLTVWSENKPSSSTHIPDLAAWPNHSADRSIYYSENIMWYYYTVYSILEEMEMLTGISPRSWSPILQPMLYGAYFQNCNASSIHQYTHHGINLYGIPLWLINFQVP